MFLIFFQIKSGRSNFPVNRVPDNRTSTVVVSILVLSIYIYLVSIVLSSSSFYISMPAYVKKYHGKIQDS